MARIVNQKDVARELGITQAAVSMALKGHPGISESLKAQVLEACRSMGYSPNYNAVSLVKRETRVVSVVMTMLSGLGEGVSQLVGHLQREVNDRGYKFRLDQGYILDGIMAERSADGFILIDCPEGYDATMGNRLDIPMMYGGGASRPLRCNSVPMDNHGGAGTATGHLLGLGHERIAFFGLIADNPLCVERYQGYVDALVQGGQVPLAPVAVPHWFAEPAQVEAYHEGVARLVGEGVTAILACSDVAAVGVMRVLAKQGLRVPEDVSVVGFDDSVLARAWLPALTTVRLDNALAARTAVDGLMGIIRTAGETEGKVIPTVLVVRDTTGPVTGKAKT